MSKTFEVLGLAAAGLAHPGLALAMSRAGGTGILDLEFCADGEHALSRFQQLLAQGHGSIGLRGQASQQQLTARLLAAAGDRALTLILAGQADAIASAAAALPRGEFTRVLAEIQDASALMVLDGIVDGYVALGHEAGGWVGDDTSYILLQKLAGKTAKPLFVRGGTGVRSAAACRAAGAAGVVLDDQLLLLAESALPDAVQNDLARLNGAETRLLGELLGHTCRVYARPGSAALKSADVELRRAESGELDIAAWRMSLQSQLGWGEGQLLPLGQGIGLAATYRVQYGNVARLLQAVRRASLRQITQAAELASLDEGAALAQSHGTRFPLVQGPMTRVSDSPDFAVKVAEGGALPLLALALMRGPQVAQMLTDTQARIGNQPWGVGMLGFVPHALREEQCAEIWKCKPAFALIAGGRPDQAAEFESRGIATYIHAPAPALLKLYLEQGARRFVFEGRECGGHVGPLASFALWEQMIEVLLAEVKPGDEAQVHVLFAGGIHDALSAAMVAAMTAPLAARGMKVGTLMGTAYLFTREIVESGAVVEGFQREALRCERTVNLETGPGHASRCVDTQFARDFHDARRTLLREGKSADEIRDALEDLNLGRLRIASKGSDRGADGRIVAIAPEQQLRDGMYMIGQVATLRERTQSIEELHLDVCRGAQQRLDALADAQQSRAARALPSDIAIVGIGTLLPKADGPEALWHNILHKVVALGEVPASRWDSALYFDADRNARDKVYSRWGGFIDEVPFDPMSYGIPPRSMKSIDPMQLLTLEVARRTLADAGYADGGYDRETTSIILGAGGGLGDLGLQYGLRAELPRFVENPDPSVWERLPEWTEESFAGTLLNVAAGRVANRMDFGGSNFTVDAACASSLAAISIAVAELESGRSSMVLAGGIDTVQSPFGYLCFSKTQALSPTGQPRTFDENADGIAISEGLATIALKRLADAERDGDRIYAVIKAVAGSSDGKALGLTAPRPHGQIRALKRAYAKAGFSPSTLSLFEAHGTGTPVGDRAEAETITRALQAENTPAHSVALGSIKTILGHTKASAGVSGLIKVALSLHHRVQPAHHGVSQPIAAIADPASPVHLLKDARPWIAHPQHPRRGGVSAFGFGGTNFHAVLEEYTGTRGVSGASRWPQELCVLRAAGDADLVRQIEALRPALAPDSALDFGELAQALARRAQTQAQQPLTLAIVASDIAALARELDQALAHLREGKPLAPSLRLNRDTPKASAPLAFLFPGQGSQYIGMGREAALYFDELRESFERADAVLLDNFPLLLSRTILPPAAFDADTERAQTAALTLTSTAQPAIGSVSLGYLQLARRLGLEAGASAGHSYGEYIALCAAGVISSDDALRLSAVRGAAMAAAAQTAAPGTMAAVQGERAAVAEAVRAHAGVRVANHNTPQQSVISGPVDAVRAAVAQLEAQGMRATLLPVSGAFHTELVGAAQAPLSTAIARCIFSAPRHTVYSNTTGAAHAADPAAIKATLDRHLLSSVEFVAEIEAMHAAGCRVFVELGPKSLCTNMVRQILAGREHHAVALDGNGGGLRGLLLGLAELYVAGAYTAPLRLFDGRELAPLDLARASQLARKPALPAHTWMISGGCARPIHDPVHRTGKLPALDKAAVDAARLKPAPQAVPASAAPIPVATSFSPALSNDALVAYQQTMRQFLALQEKVIQQFLGGSAAPSMPVMPAMPLPTAAAALPAMAPDAPAVNREPVAPIMAPAVAAPDAIDWRSTLLHIVAERTGYPADMLAPDADLEADLGVDSIKRVEILGALRKQLPADQSAQMQATMERFTKARSLNAILAELIAIAPASAAPAASVVVAASATDWRATLIGIVADRTGYPADMLAPDADLEADLGVDSIKRVEILGALRKQLPADQSAQMQTTMERFTKARSLNAILAELAAIAPAAPSPTTTTASVTASVSTPTDWRATLIGIVADRTGYPADMLAPDADLEADLGVDSIKRVEILGALRKQLPADQSALMQATMERFTKARSLNAILVELGTLAPAPVAVSAAPAVPAAATSSAVDDSAAIPRYAIKTRAAPLASVPAALSGLALVLGGPDGVVTALLRELRALGLMPVAIAAHERATMTAAITDAQREHGPVRALLHLHGLVPETPESLTQWRALGARTVQSFFHAAQAVEPALAQCRTIAATRLGGSFGRDAVGPGAPLAGGLGGITNCLRYEYPSAMFRCVDFDGQTEAEIAGLIAQELRHDDPEREAGYIGDVRYGSVSELQMLHASAFAPQLQPQADWTLLVTGGARGITAEILEEITVPGLRLVLLGRSAEPQPEDASTASLSSASELRTALLRAAQSRGEKPKPVEIDRALSRLLADREIRGTLASLRAKGAQVEYLACDARDEAALTAAIRDVYARHGRIDGVIHGAGVIEDKLLADKSVESFDRVFGTKLDPAFVFTRELKPDSLKLLAFFTSVAGRYGNRGQSDYAAANEALNRLAWSLSRAWPHTRVIAFNWGPWDAGMASDAVKQQFRERGIEPIPVAAGRRFFADELAYGSRHDVELVAGAGPWGSAVPAPVPVAAAAAQPLLRSAPRMGPGGSMTLDHVFSLEHDAYLDHHRLDGKPVLPAAGALEWMAQFAAAAWPEWQVAEVRDLRVLQGIVVDGERAVQLRARASTHSDAGTQAISVEIVDVARKLPCYRASVILAQRLPEAPLAPAALPAAGFGVREAYAQYLFHGPRFQLLQSITSLAPAGVDAMSALTTPAAWLGRDGHWLFDPALVDVAPQLAIVWSRTQRDKTALPARFGRVARFGNEPLQGPLTLRLRVREGGDSTLIYDAHYCDAQGRVRLLLEDIEGTMSAALNRLAGEN